MDAKEAYENIQKNSKFRIKLFFSELTKYKVPSKIIYLFILGFLTIYFRNSTYQNVLLLKIIEILFHFFMIQVFFNIIKVLIIAIYKKRGKYPKDHEDNFILGISRVTLLLTYVVFVLVFLILIGINVLDFLMSLSIIAVAIVLITNEYLKNMINGMILMFSDDLRLKEYIKVGDLKGRIININFLNTQIKTDDGDVVFIPNSLLINDKVINYSKSIIKRIKFNFSLSKDYFNCMDEFEKYISENVAKDFELVSEDGVLLKAVEIKKDEAFFRIEVIVSKYNFKIEKKLNNYLSKLILKFISEKNIVSDKKVAE